METNSIGYKAKSFEASQPGVLFPDRLPAPVCCNALWLRHPEVARHNRPWSEHTFRSWGVFAFDCCIPGDGSHRGKAWLKSSLEALLESGHERQVAARGPAAQSRNPVGRQSHRSHAERPVLYFPLPQCCCHVIQRAYHRPARGIWLARLCPAAFPGQVECTDFQYHPRHNLGPLPSRELVGAW